MPKLTKKFVDSVKVESKEHVLWDTELPGFGLRVKPAGRKTFIIQYRNDSGRSRRFTLGIYGKLTPAQARQMAQEFFVDITHGQDVLEIKTAKRKGLTVSGLTDRYLSEHAQPKKKPKSVKNDRQMIRDYILPTLGRFQITAITRQDISRLHHELRRKPITANRVLALLSKMMNLAEIWGLRPDGSNPCRHVQRYKERKRERYLSTDELARLGTALTEAEKTEMPSAILALRLLLLTGCRLNEILTLRWDDVDFEIGLLRLPDTKTGAKLVPLSPPSLDVLTDAPRLAGNPYVCFGEKPGTHLIGLQKIWERIRVKAGLDDVRLHDFRHSFASVATAANMGLPIIGKLLGHTQASTTQRYAHLALDPLKAASEEVAKRIDEAMKKEPKKAKVIELRNKQ